MTGPGIPVSSRVAVVSRAAVSDNVACLSARARDGHLLVDLSADAYGHGLARSAAEVTAAGVGVIGVSRLDDAIMLRDGGVSAEIVVWVPPVTGDLGVLASLGLGVGVAGIAGLRLASSSGSDSVWLLLGDRPGMATIPPDEVRAVISELATMSVRPTVNLALVGRDAAVLESALAVALRAGVQITSIAAPLVGVEVPAVPLGSRLLTRVGSEVFGISETERAAPEGTRPAMSLRAPVLAVKRAAADVGVSYGYTYRTSRDTKLALVPLGYGDGIDRSAGNRGVARLGGVRYTIAGRVAMDASVLDIGDAEVAIGDIVEFFGDPGTGAPSAQEWGAILGVPGATITSSLTARVERRWTL